MTRVAERFTVSTNIVNPQIFGAVVRLARSGTPTGTLYVNLRNDSDGVPGTVLTTIGSIDVSTLSTSFTDYNFTMSSPYSLTAGTPCWVTVEYSGGSSSNYVSTYQWSVGGHTRGYYTTSWNIETGQIAAQVLSILFVRFHQ
ncbi:MAG: choice-of-anchor R domain-containing protein [Nitrososphaerota archaeon]|nr:choice-of-anchor R domain-containing protein [Nitrososphaerota archaeon]